MSTNAFERLLYTDCRPGEGLGGGGGYQVQAQSAGCTSAQARMAVRWLLYSAQARWVNEGRPVADFPAGLSHSADAGYGTGQSRYLGKEVNGNRQGNHICDCVLTESAEPYGVIRPAQLWHAPFWRDEIWPDTKAPVLDEGLDLGPLDHDALAEWVRASPKRSTGLKRLLTVLEDPAGVRVVIRATDPEAAITWIAAATILLPMRQALTVGFRVFTNSIDDAPHRVVAVPQDLHPNLVPGSRPRTFVVDAVTDDTDVLEPSPRADFWVRQLLAAQEPYDVVEAVETAAAFGGGTEQEHADARLAAMAVIVPGEPVADAAALGRWVRRALGTDQHGAAQSVLPSLIAADGVRVDDLRVLEQLACEGVVETDAARLRMRLLDAELAQAGAGRAVPSERLPGPVLDPVQRTDAESAVVSAMIVAPDHVVDLLLALAGRHGLTLEPPSPALIDRMHGFVANWIRNPTATYRIGGWAMRDLVLDELHSQVRGRYLAGDYETLAPILRATVEHLVHRNFDMEDSFTFEIEGCYAATLTPRYLVGRVRQIVARIDHTGSEQQCSYYQDGLVRWYALDAPAAITLAGVVPWRFGLHEEVAKVARQELLRVQRRLDDVTLAAINGLAARGLLPDQRHLAEVARSSANVNALLTALENRVRSGDLGELAGELATMQKCDGEVLALSVPAFVAVSLDSPRATVGRTVLRSLPEATAHLFARNWMSQFGDPRTGYRAAAYATAWTEDRQIPETIRKGLCTGLTIRYKQLAGEKAAQWRATVADHLRTDTQRELLARILDGDADTRKRTAGRRGKGN